MPTVDFIPFATGPGADVVSQAAYASDPETAHGLGTGIALSNKFNKIWRQAAFMASVIANFVSIALAINVLDDGDLPTAITNFQNAILAWVATVFAPLASPHFTGNPTAVTQAPLDDSTRLATTAYVDNASGAVLAELIVRTPPGTISIWPLAAVPAEALACNGALVLRLAYPRLNAIAASVGYGAPFGPGDGATTFAVPDIRGYFVRGWDNGAGVDPARSIGTTQADDLAAHTHQYILSDGDGTTVPYVSADGNNTRPPEIGNTLSTGGTETRPKNIALQYIIWT